MKEKKTIKIILIVFLILISILGIYWIKTKPLEVGYTTISVEDYQDRLLAAATITAEEYVRVSPKLNAQILNVLVKEGDMVDEGQLMATLDSSQNNREIINQRSSVNLWNANLKALETTRKVEAENLEKLKIQLEGLVADQKRKEELFEQGAIPMVELEQAKQKCSEKEKEINAVRLTLASYAQNGTETNKIMQSLAQAKSSLATTESAAKDYQISSPISGRITKVYQSQGEFANPTNPMVEIARSDQKIVKAEVDEKNIAKLSLGQSVRVFKPESETDFIETVISKIAPRVNNESGTVTIECLIEQGEQSRFLYESDVVLSVLVEEYKQVPTLEAKYLLTEEDKKYIFIKEKDTAKKVEVETGGFGSRIFLKKPFSDDSIVLYPEGIKDRQKIRLKEEGRN